jgi:kynurenine--oxoglutarate transaminase/cysteine-S-conjugate beta-lyase/glutamine--phenylpyruvate transaminase
MKMTLHMTLTTLFVSQGRAFRSSRSILAVPGPGWATMSRTCHYTTRSNSHRSRRMTHAHAPQRRSYIAFSDLQAHSESFEFAHRLDGLDKPTVWQEFTPLALHHQSVNLGQGFPDWDPPAFVVEAMRHSTDPSYNRHANQYARSYAHLPLAQVLAQDYSQRWNREINPETEIATAVGCTNALFCTLQGLLNPGDEVIMLEPAFDIYNAQVRMAGGIPVYCPLRPSLDPSTTASASQHFTLDLDELEDHFSPHTKVLLLNTPHNPTGKMFSRTELEQISTLLQHKHPDVVVISDEVYEHIIFDPTKEPHISPASIDGLWDRTITLSSAGKTFSCTGWKVGWAVGPAHLIKAMTAVQQWVNFSAPTPNQDAMAQALVTARQESFEGYDTYYDYLAAEYHRKRDLLVAALQSAGMTPVIPPGGFFIMADTSHIDFDWKEDEVTPAMPTHPMPRDWALSRWFTRTVGVTAIPPSAFYSLENIPLAKNLLRFAFCKGDDTILAAHQRLKDYFQTK